MKKSLFLLLFCSFSCIYAQSLTWVSESSAGFTQRTDFASSVVNGKIYAIGGANQNLTAYIDTLEVFDPTNNAWYAPVVTGKFTPRWGLASATVDNKIYMLGGYNDKGYLNTLEMFDPDSNSWSTPLTTGTFTPRVGLAVSVVNNKIYAMGGSGNNSNGGVLNILEVFDPDSSKWSTPKTTGNFTPRAFLTSAVVNGKIYVIGGGYYKITMGVGYFTPLNTVEVFDPTSDSWTTPTTTGTFTPRGYLASAVMNNKIYVMGGQNINGEFLDTLELFDPATNSWSAPTTSGTFTPRSGLASAVIDTTIYALGGQDGNGALNTNEALIVGPTAVFENDTFSPHSILLLIYPNPVLSQTTISFSLPTSADVSIKIYDAIGRVVSSLAGKELSSGMHTIRWEPDVCDAGSYSCVFSSRQLGIIQHCELIVVQ